MSDFAEVFIANTPRDFAIYIVEEVARWAAEDFPILFEPREFKTGIFGALQSGNVLEQSIKIAFARDGYVTVKICPPDTRPEDALITRFVVADPNLMNNMVACFERLDQGDHSDFLPLAKAREVWIKSR